MLQVTGHADGSVLMWDPTGDTLKPMLIIGMDSRGVNKRAVRGVVVVEELNLLVVGYASGKVMIPNLNNFSCRRQVYRGFSCMGW